MEIQDLADEADLPLEQLMARYGYAAPTPGTALPRGQSEEEPQRPEQEQGVQLADEAIEGKQATAGAMETAVADGEDSAVLGQDSTGELFPSLLQSIHVCWHPWKCLA